MPRRQTCRFVALTAAICAALVLAGCSVSPSLREARAELPRSLAGVDWPQLLPIGSFARTTPARLPDDPASLAARAASLRTRAATAFAAPVLTPARRAALLAALARNAR
ncbi:MAG: hypothetical protein WD046_14205 [Paracoccaceae bacterium]